MLNDAFADVNEVLRTDNRFRSEDSKQGYSLLNGELVGAHALKIVIGNKLFRSMTEDKTNDDDIEKVLLKREIQQSLNELLMFADTYILSSALPTDECDIFNGRAGYLKAIKFVQTELGDPQFGRPVVRKVLAQIWEEGHDVGGGEFLLWKYKQKIHLGALHGISGILHTLLDFEEDLAFIDQNAWSTIKTTITKMNDYCLKSGNLAATLKTTLPNGKPKTKDKLVQFCLGSPGHALLLLQMHKKEQEREQLLCNGSKPHRMMMPRDGEESYLSQAQDIANEVIAPRGLLKKGVGLCHGISGNALIFLSICNACDDDEKVYWINCAYAYANFGKSRLLCCSLVDLFIICTATNICTPLAALDNLEELEDKPERPYSLYEGLGGLVCLLLSLLEAKAGAKSKFPCFEF